MDGTNALNTKHVQVPKYSPCSLKVPCCRLLPWMMMFGNEANSMNSGDERAIEAYSVCTVQDCAALQILEQLSEDGGRKGNVP
jgi:hypothetical protein